MLPSRNVLRFSCSVIFPLIIFELLVFTIPDNVYLIAKRFASPAVFLGRVHVWLARTKNKIIERSSTSNTSLAKGECFHLAIMNTTSAMGTFPHIKFKFFFRTFNGSSHNDSDNAAGRNRDRAKRASRPIPARVHPFVKPQSAI